VFPWIDVVAAGGLPAVVPPFAVMVLEDAGELEGVCVRATAVPVGEDAALVPVGCGVGVEGFEPVGSGGLVSGKLTLDAAYTVSPK
jgi:hypothetical protein